LLRNTENVLKAKQLFLMML